GFPFAFLAATHVLPGIVLVATLFVFVEMLWAPTAQPIAARLAPARLRVAYVGGLASSGNVAWMLCPLIALRWQGALGDGAVWAFLVGASVIGVVTGTLACGALAEESVAASDSAPA